MDNYNRFTGKTAIVTGGGFGIGRAICQRLALEGAKVAVHDMNLERAQETVALIEKAGGTAKAYPVDVTDREQVKAVIDQTVADFGIPNVLVCNAGINSYKDVFDFSDDEYERIINVNLNGTWYYCRHAGELMAKNGGGAIVNVTSNGAMVSSYMRAPYMASKGGSHVLTRALAQDLMKYNIRVNDVAPGTIETGMTRPDEARPGASSRPVVGMLTAAHRYGKPEELAAGVAFLASDEASYIIGATLTIDGGFAAGTPLGSGVLPIPDGTVELPWLDEFEYIKEYKAWKNAQK